MAMVTSKVLAMLLLSLVTLASTDARTLPAEAPSQLAEAPKPLTSSPIGSPIPSEPRPHQSVEMCDTRCDASVSECMVDSCLHIPAGNDQAACINNCMQGFSSCQNDCQKAQKDDFKWP